MYICYQYAAPKELRSTCSGAEENLSLYFNFDDNVHTCGKRVMGVRFFGKDDFYRNTLCHFHKVATGVIRREECKLCAGAG